MAATRGRTLGSFGAFLTPLMVDGASLTVPATGPGERRLHIVSAHTAHKPDRAPHRATSARPQKVKD